MGTKLEYIRIKNFLNGEWVEEKGKYEPLYNPSTGEVIGDVPISSREASLAAVESSYDAYFSWRSLGIGKRISYLFDLRAAMERHLEELAFSIAIDQAKHISEARGCVLRVMQLIEAACSIPTLIQGETLESVSANINGRVIRQPLGSFWGNCPLQFPGPGFRLVCAICHWGWKHLYL